MLQQKCNVKAHFSFHSAVEPSIFLNPYYPTLISEHSINRTERLLIINVIQNFSELIEKKMYSDTRIFG